MPHDTSTDLTGTVALVAGATRGAGRAVAVELGCAGATVVVTGRSTRMKRPDTYGAVLAATGLQELPGTVEDTCEQIAAEGGNALGIRCDHSDPADVADLVARVDRELGRLDVVVNNAWGGHEFFAPSSFEAPLWEQPIDQWDAMFANGVRNHIVTLQAAVPLLRRSAGRLVAAITFWDDNRYLAGNVFYDLAKATINRLAFAAAQELRADGIASGAVSPGFMRTELVMANRQASGSDAAVPAGSESPHYLGRAIVALAGAPDVADVTGGVLRVGDLARRYGFTDLDGSQPRPFTLPTADSP